MGSGMQRLWTEAGGARRPRGFGGRRRARPCADYANRDRDRLVPDVRWGLVRAAGKYEKLAGRFFGEVDPADPWNAPIADIRLAPRNARGMVEYSGNLLIIRPVDAAKGNHRLLFDINNRGNILSFGLFNDAAKNSNDPSTAADAGNGFMMRQGYTLVWGAWDTVSGTRPDVGGGPFLLDAPVARNPDGSDVVGPSLEEFVIDDDKTSAERLTYPAANFDTSRAALTFRARVDDEPTPVPADQWRLRPWRRREYQPLARRDEVQIGHALRTGLSGQGSEGRRTGFRGDARPRRVSSLRRGGRRRTSQSARRRRAAGLHRPVSRSPAGSCATSWRSGSTRTTARRRTRGAALRRMAVDGVLNWVGGGSGVFLNYRFAQPFRTHRQHIARWYPEFEFPFAYQTTTDSVTGRTDGRLRRCAASETCPKIIEANSDNEYWAKDGALAHVDTRGPRSHGREGCPHLPHRWPAAWRRRSGFRAGHLSGAAQSAGRKSCAAGLLAALDAWTAEGVEPPDSMVPRVGDGTLAGPARQEVGFPQIPGVPYLGRMHEGDLMDFGPPSRGGRSDPSAAASVGLPLSGAGSEDGRGRQYAGRRPVAGYRRAGRDLYRLEPAQEPAGRRLRRERDGHSLRPHEGAADGERRPTAIARGALSRPRVLRSRGDRKRARPRASPAASR